MSKKLLSTKFNLKLYALICGYAVWFLISQAQPITYSHRMPIYLYNTDSHAAEVSHEKIMVTLSGKRSAIQQFITTKSGMHIDLNSCKKNQQLIPITTAHILLPEEIKMVHCNPTAVTVTLS